MVIQTWLKLLYGRLSLLSLLLLVSISMAGCSKGPLSLLTGGGPNVAANVQAGKTNTQTIGKTNNISPSVSIRPKARVDTVDQSTETVNNYQIDPLLIILLILGWLAPSPSEIGRSIRNLFRRKNR